MTRWTADHTARLLASPLVALNFHDITADTRPLAADRIRRVASLGPAFDPAEDGAHVDGPRVMIGFYDGYRDAGLFGADLCAELGLRAYFFPIFTALDGRRGSMSEAEISEVATGHELGFHTASHRTAAEVGPADVQAEVEHPVRWLTELAGRPPRLAAWRGGTRYDPDLSGNRALITLGLTHLVSNWSVERLPAPDEQA